MSLVNARRSGRHDVGRAPDTAVRVTGVLLAVACLGFAGVNIVYEFTDRWGEGPYADYASAFSVMNWLVVGLKVAGAGVALLSLATRPRHVDASVMTALLWGAFAMLAVYALGSVVELVGLATGLMGNRDQIDLAGIVYVLGFLVVASGFGVLTFSYARRHGLEKRYAALGILGAPVLLATLLLGVPALLEAVGLMPS